MEISTPKYNSLKINNLSLSIGVFCDKIYDASRILSFVMKRFMRQKFEFLTLLQLATASCGRAFLCFLINPILT
jgi:hypothetical protein